MRILRYVLVPWTIFLVYSFFTFIFGQNGLYSQRYLQSELVRLSSNYESLKEANKNFYRTRDNLKTDRDSISVYARQLGYGRDNEEFIRIMGLGIAVNSDLPAGQVHYAAQPAYITDTAIKIIAALFGFLVFLFFIIRDYLLPGSRQDSRQ